MSHENQRKLEIALGLIAAIGAVFAITKSYVILPERIDAVEAQQREMRIEQRASSDEMTKLSATMQRIDERTKYIVDELKDLKSRK